MIDELPIPREVRTWIARHVQIHPGIYAAAPGGVWLDEAGYHLGIDTRTAAWPIEHRVILLYHEIAHIVRGDCLPAVREQFPDARARNVAQDAIINLAWPDETLRQIDLTPWMTSVLGLAEPCDCGDRDQAITHHVKAVLDSRDLPTILGIGDVLPRGGLLAGLTSRGVARAVVGTDVLRIDLRPVLLALRRLMSRAGSLVRSRAWTRPGRTPWTRGVVRRPRLTLGVAIDASGSMGVQDVAWAAAVARGVGREHGCRFCAFDTAVYDLGSRVPAAIPGGGGTLLAPVVDWARTHRIDAVLVLTDGEYADRGVDPGELPVFEILRTDQHVRRYRG